jgi:hypothetical protein
MATPPAPFSQAELTPPPAVAEAAAQGLELRERFHRGGTEVGEHRAEGLRDRTPIGADEIGGIYSYFQRHDVDHRPNWDDPEKPTAGYVAWLLWGGDAGRAWITRLHEKLVQARDGA